MNLNLVPISIYGSLQYVDYSNKIVASKINDSWYPSIDGVMFDAGFCNITCMSEFLNEFDKLKESLDMLGFTYDKNLNNFTYDDNKFICEISLDEDNNFQLSGSSFIDNVQHNYRFQTSKRISLENYIIKIFDKLNIDIFASVVLLDDDSEYLEIIEAKSKKGISSRDLSKNLVRVKSSNIWSWGIDIKDRKDKTGTMIIQFKDSHGGPGDLYQYMDVPVTLYRKGVGSASKGHFFWKYIRNDFKYRKLTGDKKGKLPNAIN